MRPRLGAALGEKRPQGLGAPRQAAMNKLGTVRDIARQFRTDPDVLA
jgi:hypothetical protein